MSKKVLVIGAGLGGLATALRLSSKGYSVEVVDKYSQPGGRLNQLKSDGFTFDMGPSFFSMSYEFKEFFDYCQVTNPLKFNELNPLYSVFFSNRQKPYLIYKDLSKLALEFENETNFEEKVEKYLSQARQLFEDSEYKVVKKNFDNKFQYFKSLSTVPFKHAPKLFRSMWSELERHFKTEEVKVIFSLVAFFLGATPFDTPAVYSLLNYSELKYDGYWNVVGGMYKIIEEIVKLLKQRNVSFTYSTEIVEVEHENSNVSAVKDQNGRRWVADIFVCNSDAASFRGKVLKRKAYKEEKLDKMDWTLAPFTIYLGVRGTIKNINHHNYFLGDNFTEYADNIFKTTVAPEKPYYYVNVSSKSNPECAPEGCENLFILCPVPDKRYKNSWNDREELAENIINDLSSRINFDLKSNTITKTILDPGDWEGKFNLYKGSGLGLAHGMNQIGAYRPRNKDEELRNLYYVGASTTPGTGLPIVVISSKLVTERILEDHGVI